jgi:DNA-binding winged helix-turn-helix (wHTH) protein/tetratricopeptide (TPR) repeat protein
VNRQSKLQIPGEIQLADEDELRVGKVIVRPATLEILVDGTRETIEPRMMQLLVALARARGQVVSRDSLVFSCWGGRAVGDDAINRCVAKVRRLAGGAAGFRVETINRVGYRLVEALSQSPDPLRPIPPPTDQPTLRPNRRLFLGAGAAAAIAATTGFFLLDRRGDAAAPPDVAPLMTQARIALNQCSPEGVSQSIGLLRQIVEIRPAYAEGWSALSLAYAFRAHGRGSGNFDEAERHARSAAVRALQLDPKSAYAKAALGVLQYRLGQWTAVEQALRSALADLPRDGLLSQMLSIVLLAVGRDRDAAAALDEVVPAAQPSPSFLDVRIFTLWAAGRLDETDQVIERASALYPTYLGIWFARFNVLLSSGRVGEAIRFAEEADGRPVGIPAGDFENALVVARALASHRQGDIDRAIARNRAAAQHGVGYAENLIQYTAVLGRVDDAFAAANAVYFGPASARDAPRFSAEQQQYSRAGDRNTALLFTPMTQAMRSDPRFSRLTAAIGLDHYWAQSGHQPDYRRPNS